LTIRIFFSNLITYSLYHPLPLLVMTMSVAERKIVTIPKEQVNELRFPSGEVLLNRDDIQRRRRELERALALGNLEKSKVRIIFEDDGGMKMVETTIWSLTDDRVILKGNMGIPLRRIWQVIA
jgi:hypothetical protein